MKFPRQNKLKPKDDVVFQITSWYTNDEEYDDDNDEENSRQDSTKYLVKVFGVTEQGQSVSVNLTDFPPFFYLKPAIQNLTEYHVRQIKEFIVEKLPFSLKNGLQEVKVMKKKDFWGFTNSKNFNFIRLSFKNIKTYRAAARIFQRKVFIRSLSSDMISFKLYESNIDPFLRLAHIKNIDPAGWVRIPQKLYHENIDLKTTRCQIDITARWNAIESVQMEKMAPLIVASFDIECTSSHGDFPVAQKTYKKLSNELIQFFDPTKHSKQDIYDEIIKTFSHQEQGHLSKVFPKQHINPANQLKRHLDDIYTILQGRFQMKKQQPTKDAIIKSLTDHLGKCLPPLEGDPVIQIGTTVHVYGEKECTYKHIATLGSCDPVDGVEVQVCKNEKDLILAWKNIITDIDPDVLIGYNIFGFDMSYLYERAKEHNIDSEFCQIGKMLDHESPYVEKVLSSNALGDNLLKYVDMEGRVLIDMMKLVQRDHKLDSYKLDTVASTFLGGKIIESTDNTITVDNTKGLVTDSFIKINDDKFKIIDIIDNKITLDANAPAKASKWGLAKDDITPKQIFECHNGSSADRAMVAKYCIKDCALCNYLLMKLETLANNVGMANVCSVPLSYIFMRGQGIKIFSLVAKQCRTEDFLIPVLFKNQKEGEDEEEDEEGYEGAIVLEPKEGIYIDTPISVLDYASLYPSSMISENLSHDCIVLDSKYDNLEGFEYLDICYDIYEKQGDKKVKTGVRTCRFVQLPEKGVIPRILMHLLKQRKLTRKKIEFETVITHDNIEYSGLVSDVENGKKVTYLDGKSEIITSDQIKLVQDTYDDFQKAVLDGLQLAYKVTANSLYGQCGARTSQIYMKDIAACTTATGRKMILLAKDYIEKKSTEFHTAYEPDVVYGDSVTGDTPLIIRFPDGHIDIKQIDSLTEDWIPYENFKPHDNDRYHKEQSFIDAEIWTDGKWSKIHRVIRHKTNKKLFRVNTLEGSVDVTEDHSLIDVFGKQIKPEDCKINETILKHSFPQKFDSFERKISWTNYTALLNSAFNVRKEFVDRYYKNKDLVAEGFHNKIEAQMMFYLAASVGLHPIVQEKDRVFYIEVPMVLVDTQKVISIEQLSSVTQENFVYDIETESGVFQGGVGSLVLKNTDSLFLKLDFKDALGNPIKGHAAIPIARELGIKISKEIKAIIKPPHDLEWEKLFYPFILFSKKRYCANKYEHDDHKYKMNSMGIVLKRRDNAQIVKTIYGGVLNIILNEQNIRKSIAFLKDNLQQLTQGNFPLEELVISKSLKGEYKDPDKIAHKVLADRMKERDEGSAPQVNDRIPFVYIQTPASKAKKVLQGERIEHPDYIRENNIKPDYEFYITNQIMKPCLQLYALVLEQLDGYKPNVDYKELKVKLIKEKDGDTKKAKDKWNDLREDEVRKLLFDPVLIKLQNKKNHMREITDFFKPT